VEQQLTKNKKYNDEKELVSGSGEPVCDDLASVDPLGRSIRVVDGVDPPDQRQEEE